MIELPVSPAKSTGCLAKRVHTHDSQWYAAQTKSDISDSINRQSWLPCAASSFYDALVALGH